MRVLVDMLLLLLALVAVVIWGITLFRELRSSSSKERAFGRKKLRHSFLVLVLAGVPLCALFQFELDLPTIGAAYDWWLSASLALLISGVWMLYIRGLDIYEPDPWWALAVVFLLSCASIWLVWPISDAFLDSGWYLGGSMLNDLIYCIVVIGGVEEFVKLLPVLLLLRFTKWLNEPFDLILYGCTSALGFAFIENTTYLKMSELLYFNARAFMASVAHMTFTSWVCYGIMLHRFQQNKPRLPVWGFFGLAAFAHGFYDFWLIHDFGANLSWITTVFFIISIHLWSVMKNNAINQSNFYSPKVHLVNAVLKRRLLFSLLALVLISSFVVLIRHGQRPTQQFLRVSAVNYGFIALYLIFSIDKFKVVKAYLAPFNLPLLALIPKTRRKYNLTGMRFEVSSLTVGGRKHQLLSKLLPVNGEVIRSVVLEKEKGHWAVLVLDKELSANGVDRKRILFQPLGEGVDPFEQHAPIKVALVKDPADASAAAFKPEDVLHIGQFFSTPISVVN